MAPMTYRSRKMEKKADYTKFQNDIISRGIEHLIHFTPTINLLSILQEERILSRALLEMYEIDQTDILDFIEFTDSIRYDDKNYINLSISSPNYLLFDRFQERTNSMPHINWCILKINPKYIYQEETLFSVTNAASTIAKKHFGITGDFNKFQRLFEDRLQMKYGIATRGGLKPKYPTDVQAEVLVRNEIPISDILEVCFKDHFSLAAARAALSDYETSNFSIDQSLFLNKRT
jgi:hypothetical protein